ncbi:MAG: hypothetical protein ACRCY7_00045 [Cetobacterium sp.]|uniref:hypothetical protein n=1 Tax=Cetobacterium sp. TaxID=2071632 RepID=UPI003F376AFD
MILSKINNCKNVKEIIKVVNSYSLNQIKYEILSLSGTNLGNKNKGVNTPIFNMNLPIIRSIYGACLSILGNDYHPREQTKLNCEIVIGNSTSNGFYYYTKEDVYLAIVGNRLCSEIGIVA